jgi:hypothetical protein
MTPLHFFIRILYFLFYNHASTQPQQETPIARKARKLTHGVGPSKFNGRFCEANYEPRIRQISRSLENQFSKADKRELEKQEKVTFHALLWNKFYNAMLFMITSCLRKNNSHFIPLHVLGSRRKITRTTKGAAET